MSQVPTGTCIPERTPVPNLMPSFIGTVGVTTRALCLEREDPRRKDGIKQSYGRGTPVLRSGGSAYDVVQTLNGPIHVQKPPAPSSFPVDFLKPVYDTRLQSAPLRYFSR